MGPEGGLAVDYGPYREALVVRDVMVDIFLKDPGYPLRDAAGLLEGLLSSFFDYADARASNGPPHPVQPAADVIEAHSGCGGGDDGGVARLAGETGDGLEPVAVRQPWDSVGGGGVAVLAVGSVDDGRQASIGRVVAAALSLLRVRPSLCGLVAASGFLRRLCGLLSDPVPLPASDHDLHIESRFPSPFPSLQDASPTPPVVAGGGAKGGTACGSRKSGMGWGGVERKNTRVR